MNGSFVTANASGLSQGQYTTQITINSNAGNEPSLVIPVTLNVTVEVDEGDPDGPIAQVTPESLAITLPPDVTENIDIEIFNAGDENLTWSGSAPLIVGWISPGMPNAGNVQPGMINVTSEMSPNNKKPNFCWFLSECTDHRLRSSLFLLLAERGELVFFLKATFMTTSN